MFYTQKIYKILPSAVALGLLAILKLIHISEPLAPISYLISIKDESNAPDRNNCPEVWADLKEVNRLNELRANAMEVFSHLPNGAQTDFIEGYFSISSSGEMEQFLDQQVRLVEVDTEEGKGLI